MQNKSNKTYYVEFNLDNPDHVGMVQKFMSGQEVVKGAREANYVALVDTGKKSAWVNVNNNLKGAVNVPIELFTIDEYISHVRNNDGQVFVLMFRTYYKAKNNYLNLFGLNEGPIDFLKSVATKIKQGATDVINGIRNFIFNVVNISPEIEVLNTGGESIEKVKDRIQSDIQYDLDDNIGIQTAGEKGDLI